MPEMESIVDEKKWQMFRRMREQLVSFSIIAKELRISVTQAMALEVAHKCVIKHNGDEEKVAKCLRGEIDP